MNFTEVVPKSLRAAVQEKLDEVVERGAARIEVPVLTPEGHTIPFEARGRSSPRRVTTLSVESRATYHSARPGQKSSGDRKRNGVC